MSRINIHIADESNQEYDEDDIISNNTNNNNNNSNNTLKDSYGVNNEEAAGILVKHMGKLKTQWQV